MTRTQLLKLIALRTLANALILGSLVFLSISLYPLIKDEVLYYYRQFRGITYTVEEEPQPQPKPSPFGTLASRPTPLKITPVSKDFGIVIEKIGANAPIVAAAAELTGADAQTVAFGTEGPLLNRLGIDSLILGPGDIAQAHQPDEYLARERIAPMVRILRGLIARFCL